MDTLCQEFPDPVNRFILDFGPMSCSSNWSLLHNGYKLSQNLSDRDPSFYSINTTAQNDSSSCSSPDAIYPNNNAVLKYISDMLMEEDLEGKNCMLQDCLALQAAEKSFYDVLGQKYPHSSDQFLSVSNQTVESPDDDSAWTSSVDSTDNNPISNTLVEFPNGPFDPANLRLSSMQNFLINSPEFKLLRGADFPSEVHPFEVNWRGTTEIANSVSHGESLVLALNSSSSKPHDKEKRDYSPNNSRGRKLQQREGSDDLEEEERSNKHSAFSLAESEQSDMFDKVLLCQGEDKSCVVLDKQQNGASRNGQRKGSKGKAVRTKKGGNKGELVDWWTLLSQCAQAVATLDQRTANELLKQIRQHSSPFGDGNQRLSHYFANALEARLAGTRTPAYSPVLSNRTPAVDILKAYKVYVEACPFKKMSNFFANQTIFKLVVEASRIHIIDFGILYGFQWPCLIQRLSRRPGGPPKLRITGIELPQPGFRPAERVEETARRLGRYCERFKVPFDFHVIAQKWETIKYEDLKINREEMVVVNSLYRLRNLPDDTVVANSARDTVLQLIKKINPDIFIQGVINGTYNSPFFVTRFKEALLHFSSLFDMFEVTVPREDEQRSLYERELFGRDIMNVIACEGAERVERPETYKQWQLRNLRAGFRQLPLDQEILSKVKFTVRSDYDSNFVIDEDGHWMLQGWKGRMACALSVWKPVQD
uniref:Transcription factor n=1 Tax=Rhizophora mucronata TaxID=61149 RepID=A0A2P2JRP3_RHIMU